MVPVVGRAVWKRTLIYRDPLIKARVQGRHAHADPVQASKAGVGSTRSRQGNKHLAFHSQLAAQFRMERLGPLPSQSQ